MSVGLTYIIACAGVVLPLLAYFVSIRKYPSAPGPWLARWTALWYVFKTSGGRFEKWSAAQHAQHGKVVRIAPDKYSIDDPVACKQIYGFSAPLQKSTWYSFAADPAVGPNHNLFSVQDREMHSAMRRRQAGFYSMTSIKTYEPFVDECVAVFVEQFNRIKSSGEVINLQIWLQCYALDAISQMTYGVRHAFVDNGAKDPDNTIGWLERLQWFATLGGLTFPWGVPFLVLRYGSLISGAAKFVDHLDKQAEKKFDDAAMVESDDEGTGKPVTFFEKLLKARRASPGDFDKHHTYSATSANMLAGSDTTSIALCSIMYHAIKYPRVWKRLQRELQEAVANGTVTHPITFDQAQSLPYLQCVIKESMRIHPSIGLPLWRLVPQGGMEIGGISFPESTWIGINPWVAHRNKEVFGQDADVFNPDRWDTDVVPKNKLDQMSAYSLAFGSGARTCMGKNVSILEMNKLIPELVRRYDFDLIQPDKEPVIENNWFVKHKHINVRVLPAATQ